MDRPNRTGNDRETSQNRDRRTRRPAVLLSQRALHDLHDAHHAATARRNTECEAPHTHTHNTRACTTRRTLLFYNLNWGRHACVFIFSERERERALFENKHAPTRRGAGVALDVVSRVDDARAQRGLARLYAPIPEGRDDRRQHLVHVETCRWTEGACLNLSKLKALSLSPSLSK